MLFRSVKVELHFLKSLAVALILLHRLVKGSLCVGQAFQAASTISKKSSRAAQCFLNWNLLDVLKLALQVNNNMQWSDISGDRAL